MAALDALKKELDEESVDERVALASNVLSTAFANTHRKLADEADEDDAGPSPRPADTHIEAAPTPAPARDADDFSPAWFAALPAAASAGTLRKIGGREDAEPDAAVPPPPSAWDADGKLAAMMPPRPPALAPEPRPLVTVTKKPEAPADRPSFGLMAALARLGEGVNATAARRKADYSMSDAILKDADAFDARAKDAKARDAILAAFPTLASDPRVKELTSKQLSDLIKQQTDSRKVDIQKQNADALSRLRGVTADGKEIGNEFVAPAIIAKIGKDSAAAELANTKSGDMQATQQPRIDSLTAGTEQKKAETQTENESRQSTVDLLKARADTEKAKQDRLRRYGVGTGAKGTALNPRGVEIDPDAASLMGEEYFRNGTLPPMPRNPVHMPMWLATIRDIKQRREAAGAGFDPLVAKAERTALTLSLSQNQKTLASVVPAEKTALGALNIVLNMSAQDPRLDIPVLEKLRQEGLTTLTSDPVVSKLQAALNTFRSEYMKVLIQAGQVTQAERDHLDQVINTAMSQKTIKAVADVLKTEMDLRRTSLLATNDELKRQIGELGGGPNLRPPSKTPAAGPANTEPLFRVTDLSKTPPVAMTVGEAKARKYRSDAKNFKVEPL